MDASPTGPNAVGGENKNRNRLSHHDHKRHGSYYQLAASGVDGSYLENEGFQHLRHGWGGRLAFYLGDLHIRSAYVSVLLWIAEIYRSIGCEILRKEIAEKQWEVYDHHWGFLHK
jgi:hypothetical protein